MKSLLQKRTDIPQVDLWATLETVTDGLALLDAEGIIFYLNPAWQQQLHSEALQTNCRVGNHYLAAYTTIFAQCSADIEAIRSGLHAILNGTLARFDFAYCEPIDSHEYWFHVTITPYFAAATRGALLQQRDTHNPQQTSRRTNPTSTPVQSLEARAAQHRHLFQTTPSNIATLNFAALIPRLHSILRNVLSYDIFKLCLLDQQTEEFFIAARVGREPHLDHCPQDLRIPLGSGIVSAAFFSHHGELVNHAQHDPRSVYLDESSAACEHLIGVPLRVQGNTLGVAIVVRTSDPPFTPEEFEQVRFFVEYVALALENDHLTADMQRQAHELDLLARAGLALGRSTDIQNMAYTAVETASSIFGYTNVSLYLLRGDMLVLKQSIGPLPTPEHLPLDDSLVGKVLQSRQPVLLTDSRHQPGSYSSGELVSYMCVPLFDEDSIIGVLHVQHSSSKALSADDMHLFSLFSMHVSIALERARLHGQVLKREQQYRSVIVSVKEVIFQTDREGRWTFLTPAWIECTGFLLSDSIGMHFLEFIHPDDHALASYEFECLLQGEKPSSRYELRYISQKNGLQWAEMHTWPILGNNSEIQGISGILNDITERKLTEKALQEREQHFQSLIENATDVIMVLDIKGTIHYVSPSVERILHYTPSALVQRTIYHFIHSDETTVARYALGMALQSPGKPQNLGEYRFCMQDGTWKVFEVIATSLLDNPTVQGIVVNCHDITERKAAEERLQRMALYDALTGLPNRAFLMERLQQMLEHLQKQPDYLFAMLFLDMDNFKVVNDSLGHLVGDEFLKEITFRLRECVRAEDMVARLGGDEFTILLDSIKHAADAIEIADRIKAALARPFLLDTHEIIATASIGIALGSMGYQHAQDLLRDADTAMYHAKEQGKAGYAIFDQNMHTRAMERLLLQTDLQHSIERRELRIHYQPIVELASDRIIGFEALLRWQHPQRGLLPPSEFVNVAEETGSIIPIGHWVLLEACQQLRLWQMRFPQGEALTMSVNLSNKQFKHLDLNRDIDDILQQSGITADRLTLEIPETVIMEKTEFTAQALHNLQSRGVRLCIDDFGTGQASLSHLYNFPIYSLKIDSSFVNSLENNERGLTMVHAMVTLASNLGIEVIAEGVETALQAAYLRNMGCSYAQGFFFSNALDSTALEHLLDSHEAPPPPRLAGHAG